MRLLVILSTFILTGCGGGVPTLSKDDYNQVVVIVKSKRTEVLSQADWHNQFRQQAVIIDKDDNEYRFNIGTDFSQYNLLVKGKKYILFSYRGYGSLSKVVEVQDKGD